MVQKASLRFFVLRPLTFPIASSLEMDFLLLPYDDDDDDDDDSLLFPLVLRPLYDGFLGSFFCGYNLFCAKSDREASAQRERSTCTVVCHTILVAYFN
jgi:hypothetical protein